MQTNNADFHFIRFKMYQDNGLWYGVSTNSYDTLGTVIEAVADSKHNLYQNLYLEISDIFFGEYEVDMFISPDFTIDFLLSREHLHLFKSYKSN